MGLSSSKTTTGPSKQAMPYLTAATNTVQGAYAGSQANTADITNTIKGAFDKYSVANPTLAAGNQYAQDVIGGKFLDAGNPYLQGMIDTTNQSVTDQINALFSKSGQTGSSRQIGELGKQLATAENNLRYQNYGSERDRMSQAAALGATLSAAESDRYQTLAGLGSTANALPLANAFGYANALGGLWGNSQTTKQSGGLGQQLLSLGSSLGSAAILASDRRLKQDIRKVGELADGLAVYVWRYIWGGPEHRGVMADEVADKRPWALGPKIAGEYLTVDYGQLPEFA